MSVRVAVGRAVLFTVIGVLSAAACSTSDESSPSSESAAKVIGPDGGTLIGPSGATLIVPAQALSVATRLSITRVHGGYPELLTDDGLASPVFAFEPHGQTFAEEVTLRIPFARGTNDVQLVSAAPGGSWGAVPGTARDGVLEARSSHFSFYAVIVAPSVGGGDGGSSGMDGSAGAMGGATEPGSGGEGGEASSSGGTGGASAGSGGTSVAGGGANAAGGGTSGGTGGASAGSGGTNAASGGANAGGGGTSGGSGGASAGNSGTGGGGAKVCMAPVANAPTGTSGLAGYPKGIARLQHSGSGTSFTTTLSLQFSTVDQCGYVMAGTTKNVQGKRKDLYIRSTTAEPAVTVGTYQPIDVSDNTSTGFTDGFGDCVAGAVGPGEPNTTLELTSVSDARVTGVVKNGSTTVQTFDVPICASQVAYCGCVP